MRDFQMERVDLTCPKCGRRDYMYRLSGKNVGKLNIKCTNCNSYYDSTADYSYLLGIRQKEEPMDDLISRQAAIDAVETITWYHQNRNNEMVSGANSELHQAWYKADDVYAALNNVPTAEKRGEWISHEGYEECSQCGKFTVCYSKFCPNCGARMEE